MGTVCDLGRVLNVVEKVLVGVMKQQWVVNIVEFLKLGLVC